MEKLTAVDVSEMSAGLFILDVIFLLLVFGFLSFGILSMFQQKFRRGWFSFGGAVAFAIVFGIILKIFYI